MKIPGNDIVLILPDRPIPYNDADSVHLYWFINGLSIEPPIPATECGLLDLWLQQAFHNYHLPCPTQDYTVAQLTDTLIDRFGDLAVDYTITEMTTTNMLRHIFNSAPTIKFRQFQLTLKRDNDGQVSLRVGFHPGESLRVKQYAWRLAGLSLNGEEADNEHQQSAAA